MKGRADKRKLVNATVVIATDDLHRLSDQVIAQSQQR